MEIDTTFETERLLLRPITMDDAPCIHAVLGDPEAVCYGSCGVMSLESVSEDTKWNLEERLPGMLPLGERLIVLKDGAISLGWCGLQRFPKMAEGTAEVYYNIVPAHWGHGYATEAARAMLDHGFRDVGLDEIVAMIHRANQRSIRVAEKLGLKLREASGDGTVYAMTRPEYACYGAQANGN